MENKLVSLLVVFFFGRHLMGCPHLYVEDRWPSFPSEERVGGRKGS